MRVLVLGLCLLVSQGVQAQNILSGRVLDETTNKALPYVNIGIAGKNVGTLSSADGAFSLTISAENLFERITFSAIGFENRTFTIDSLLQEKGDLVIRLSQKSIDLGEFIVESKGGFEDVTLGITSLGSSAFATHDFRRGAQITQLISYRDYPMELIKIRLHINSRYSPLSLRMRVFDVDKETGLPGNERLHTNVIHKVKKRKPGWVEVDVSDYGLWMEDDFFVSVEFIGKGNYLFSTIEYAEFPEAQYVRMTSLGTWLDMRPYFKEIKINPKKFIIGAVGRIYGK